MINLPAPAQWSAVERPAPLTGRNPVPPSKPQGCRFEPDKFAAAGLTGEPSHLVRPPRVAECPIQLEARAERIRPDVSGGFVIVEAVVRKVHADSRIVVPGTDHVEPAAWSPLIHSFRHYFGLGPELGHSYRSRTRRGSGSPATEPALTPGTGSVETGRREGPRGSYDRPMATDIRIEQAELHYERAVFGGETSSLATADQGLDAVEADLALARGRLAHARFLDGRAEDARELELFQKAGELFGRLGDARGEGEALFWVGVVHQVVRDDTETALPSFTRALELATKAGDRLTMSYALRHLGFAEDMAGRPDAAQAHLEESTRLRRELGFLPGVAANLITLAEFSAGQNRRDEADALLKEAAELAERSDAKRVSRWVSAARERLGLA